MTGTPQRTLVQAQTLAGIEALTDLNPEQRADIAAHCHGYSYPADHEIISHSDKTTDVYFLVTGKVRATLYSFSGKTVIFRDIVAGQVFGDLSAIDGQPRSATVVTLSACLVVSMSSSAFQNVLREHGTVAWAILRELADLTRQLSERIVEFSTLGVKNRLHAELLRLARDGLQSDGSAVVSPVPTDEEIASRISTHREAVNRELRYLEKIGLIERRAGKRIVRDVARLEKLVKDVRGE